MYSYRLWSCHHLQVHQLQHELLKKDELLRVVSSVSEESETDSSSSPSLSHASSNHTLVHTLTLSQLELLQSKLQELEEENYKLRVEVRHIITNFPQALLLCRFFRRPLLRLAYLANL